MAHDGWEQSVRSLLDKQAITETLLRYCRGIDRLHVELIRSAYHPDSTDDHGLFKGNGHDFASWAMTVLPNLEISQHKISNIQIELSGDFARVETYFLAVHVPKGGNVEEFVYGRYVDRFELRDGGWKIADRKVVLDFSTVHPRGQAYPYKDKFLQFARDRTDPVYAS